MVQKLIYSFLASNFEMQHTVILSPLYNDENSFRIFASAVEKETEKITNQKFSFLVVDDGSDHLNISSALPLTIIHLYRNIGHQKAIAIGLAYTHHNFSYDNILIMDCDGEDKPEDISRLLSDNNSSCKIVVAKRGRRQETWIFKIFYYFYKIIFYILIGKRISFGNFMLIPKREIEKIIHFNEIWNNLAGAIIKSTIPYSVVATNRGKRYEGKSKMNFSALLLHGLGALGVFIEIIASRLLIFFLSMIIISFFAITIIFYVKFFTEKAIPSWTTIAFSTMLVVLLQSFLISLFTIFMYLSFQGSRKFVPFYHYKEYVRTIENLA